VDSSIARRLFEAVAEDERLRGDLTDEGYAPLLAWCAQRAAQLASADPPPGLSPHELGQRPATREGHESGQSPARGEGHEIEAPPGADFDGLAAALRAAVAAIVRAAESGDERDLAGISPDVIDSLVLSDLRRGLAAAPRSPDARARALVSLLASRTP